MKVDVNIKENNLDRLITTYKFDISDLKIFVCLCTKFENQVGYDDLKKILGGKEVKEELINRLLLKVAKINFVISESSKLKVGGLMIMRDQQGIRLCFRNKLNKREEELLRCILKKFSDSFANFDSGDYAIYNLLDSSYSRAFFRLMKERVEEFRGREIEFEIEIDEFKDKMNYNYGNWAEVEIKVIKPIEKDFKKEQNIFKYEMKRKNNRAIGKVEKIKFMMKYDYLAKSSLNSNNIFNKEKDQSERRFSLLQRGQKENDECREFYYTFYDKKNDFMCNITHKELVRFLAKRMKKEDIRCNFFGWLNKRGYKIINIEDTPYNLYRHVRYMNEYKNDIYREKFENIIDLEKCSYYDKFIKVEDYIPEEEVLRRENIENKNPLLTAIIVENKGYKRTSKNNEDIFSTALLKRVLMFSFYEFIKYVLINYDLIKNKSEYRDIFYKIDNDIKFIETLIELKEDGEIDNNITLFENLILKISNNKGLLNEILKKIKEKEEKLSELLIL